MEVLFVSALVIAGIVGYLALMAYLGSLRKQGKLRRKDERRHSEQLDWRRTGQLPARYVTIYERGEMVDEDMARMVELGYYGAEDADLVGGGRRVIYRLGGMSAL